MSWSKPAVRTVVLAVLTLVSAATVYVAFPKQQTLGNVGVLLAHLVPFVFATETIASLKPAWFERWRLRELTQIVTLAIVFFGFVPMLFHKVIAQTLDFDKFYYLMLTLVPLLILTWALHFRLGGGNPGAVRRAAYANLLLMLSGIEDVMFWVWQHKPVPEHFTWASHINVFLGHVATRADAYVFIAIHVVLAALIVFLPDRFWRRLGAAITGLVRRSNRPVDPNPTLVSPPEAVRV